MGKRFLSIVILGLSLAAGVAAQAPAKSAESAKTTWFFYTVQASDEP